MTEGIFEILKKVSLQEEIECEEEEWKVSISFVHYCISHPSTNERKIAKKFHHEKLKRFYISRRIEY